MKKTHLPLAALVLLTACASQPKEYPELVKKSGDDFRILQLADLHVSYFWEGNAKLVQDIFEFIQNLVDETRPDLLVLTGDNIRLLFNSVNAHALINFLDSLTIPYALVMGNHDGEWWGETKSDLYQRQVANIYAAGRYSLFTRGPKEVYGEGNYPLIIRDENNAPFYGLIMLDSNRDYIRSNQVDWYEEQIITLQKETPGLKTLVFFHIPLPEIKEIQAEMDRNDPQGAADAFRESPGAQIKNTGLFQKMKELHSTTHIFFGHDHVNCLDYLWDGIHFVYGVKTGPASYYSADRLGGTLILLHDDHSVTVRHVTLSP